MLYFENDYSEGAHPKILQRLMDTNMEHLSGYGSDRYTDLAKIKSGISAAARKPKFIFWWEELRQTRL